MNSGNTENLKPDHISICVCTFKRPAMLERLLDGLSKQSTFSTFTFEIVIVDNDKMRSAEDLVNKIQERGQLKIIYDCEPEQSISLARNRTIRNASGNFIATIDDDEFPAEDWLKKIYQCLKHYNADGVLGPVLPHFPPGAPEWLKRSGLCDRPRNVTGSPITGKDLRTGNVLFQRSVFKNDNMWFDPTRGLTGGSDGEFLSRQIKKGRKFIWCDEAIVFETVADERWPASFYLKRQFRIGTISGKIIRRFRKIHTIPKTCFLVLGYAGLLPFAMFAGKHIWMKILTKLSYNVGRLLSFFKLVRAQERQ